MNPLPLSSLVQKNTTNSLSITNVTGTCGAVVWYGILLGCSNLLSVVKLSLTSSLTLVSRLIATISNAARDEFEAMDTQQPVHTSGSSAILSMLLEKKPKRFFDTIGEAPGLLPNQAASKYFQGAHQWLLANSDIQYPLSCLLTPTTRSLDCKAQQPRLIPYYLGQRRLITLFMKLDADVVVTPSALQSSTAKQHCARRWSTCMCHHMTSMTVASNAQRGTPTDDVTVGLHQQHDLGWSKYYGTPSRKAAINTIFSTGQSELPRSRIWAIANLARNPCCWWSFINSMTA